MANQKLKKGHDADLSRRRSCRKKSKYAEAHIGFALTQAERGMPVPGARRKMGVSGATFFNWRKKCGSLGPSGLHTQVCVSV
jgi:hypothetical protein